VSHRLGQHVDEADTVLDSGDHEILHVLALDALGGGDMGDGLTITAVEGQGDADLLLVVAADLEAVGAPSDIRVFDSDLTFVATIICARFGRCVQALQAVSSISFQFSGW